VLPSPPGGAVSRVRWHLPLVRCPRWPSLPSLLGLCFGLCNLTGGGKFRYLQGTLFAEDFFLLGFFVFLVSIAM
jgi:hypothetical protein